MRRFNRVLTTVLMTTTALTSMSISSAHAQQLALEEIVVTATRRAESAQDIPINITAVATVDIQRLRLSNIAELARWVPGLNPTDQGPRGGALLSVRGLNTDSLNASEFLGNSNGETVGTYIGEIPYYLDLKLYDIDRVEVLIGPQGTLYGAGTLGGPFAISRKRLTQQNFQDSYTSIVTT